MHTLLSWFSRSILLIAGLPEWIVFGSVVNMNKKTITRKSAIISPHLMTGQERLLLLRNIRGMWKNRKPDPIKELEKIRREWDREIV